MGDNGGSRGESQGVWTITYLEDGRVDEVDDVSALYDHITFHYDDMDRLESVVLRNATGDPVLSSTVTYDADDNVVMTTTRDSNNAVTQETTYAYECW